MNESTEKYLEKAEQASFARHINQEAVAMMDEKIEE